MKEKEESEKNLKGEARILATFIIEGEKVYGIKVTKGKANMGDTVELYKNKNLVSKSKIISLRVRSEPVEEVKKDQEAGIILSPQLDMSTGDMIKLIL
jgi:translation initiation factor IF-2